MIRKRLVVLTLILCAAGTWVFLVLFCPFPVASQANFLEGRITISGAWALYPLVVRWAEEFKKIQPRVRVDVQAGGAGKGMADILAGAADLAMVSRDLHPEEMKKGAVAWPVAKDAVVAVVSARNPYLQRLLGRGLTRQELKALWVDGTLTSWNSLLELKEKAPVHVYTRSDACGAAETWASFLDARQEDLKGTGVYGDPGIAEAVRRDPLGIGYNNLNFAYDPKTLLPVKGLIVLPLDLNDNGKVDPEEAFVARRSDLTRAIQQGKYPSPPARDLYLVTRGKPSSPQVVGFLRYVLGPGQELVEDAGYVRISPEVLDEAKRLLESERKN